jgi:anti-anti-sigma regulatory factor
MDLRLTVTRAETSTVVRVDGRLSVQGVREFERLAQTIDGPMVLDLTHLVSADDAGVTLLRTFAGQGAQLIGTTPYMQLLLESDSTTRKPHRKDREAP